MAATGKTPILLYGSTTSTNTPVAGNLTNSSDGCEIAINVADKNLFFKDSTNTVNTVPIRQSSASSNGWLSSTDWSTFNGKQPAGTYVTSVTGIAPVVSSGGTTPAISMAAANGSTNGYLSSTDWTTFNNKVSSQWTTSGSNIYYTTGRVGIGTATPGTYFDLSAYEGSNWISTTVNTGTSGHGMYFGYNNNSSTTYGLYIAGGRGLSNQLDLAVANKFYVYGDGGVAIGTTNPGANNLGITNGNLVIGTSGKGIDFSATPGTGTSELLADYEEGTWTVKLWDAASGGNQSATTVTGYYTKVGNLVNCAFTGLNAISTSGMTAGNTLYIELPFTASSTGIGTGSMATENFAFGTGRTNITPTALNSNSRAILRAYGSGTSSASIVVSNVTSGSANIDYFSLTYKT